MPDVLVRRYDNDPFASSHARRWSREKLHAQYPNATQWPNAIETIATVELIVSELVTNGLRAGSEHCTVTIQLEKSWLRIGVADDAAGLPRLSCAGVQDDHGRGLAIIAALSLDWGVITIARGKEVWATVEAPSSR